MTPLTDNQIKELAKVLLLNGGNVYNVVQRQYGIKVGEEIFDQLEKVGDIFKCEECNLWMENVDGLDGICHSCSEDMEG